MENIQPSFYAVLTADIRYCKSLNFFEKVLFAEMTALTHCNGYCHATNRYFAELFGKTKETISRAIHKFKNLGLIKIKINDKNQRFVYLSNAKFVDKKAVKNRSKSHDKNVNTDDKNINGVLMKISTPDDENINALTYINNINNINTRDNKKDEKNKDENLAKELEDTFCTSDKVDQKLENRSKYKAEDISSHHLFVSLSEKNRELYLEYIELREKLKMATTVKIHERLLKKFNDFGCNPEVIENAITGNWKDFYQVKNFNQKPTQVQVNSLDPILQQAVSENKISANTAKNFEFAKQTIVDMPSWVYEACKKQKPSQGAISC